MREKLSAAHRWSKFAWSIKIQVDHSDGNSIRMFDRCAVRDCRNSMIPPIQTFVVGRQRRAVARRARRCGVMDTLGFAGLRRHGACLCTTRGNALTSMKLKKSKHLGRFS
jgi:hypothetical protein